MAVLEFAMPTLGADMDYGRIVSWLIKPGDKVTKGQLVAEVETPKSNIEIESFSDGILQEIHIPEGQKVKVGIPIALFEIEGTAKEVKEVESTTKKFKLSPRAKKLCRDNNISKEALAKINKLVISGEDIETLLKETSMPRQEINKIDQRQQIIAHLMEKSKQTIPHFFVEKEINLDVALSWMHKENEERKIEERYIPAVLFIKALALALKKYPKFNGIYANNTFTPSENINLGIIISLRTGGLIAPAIEQVDKKSLDQLMQEFRDLVARARAEKLKATEMQSSTICLTNLGDQGADRVLGIIYPPQVAIIGTGAILEQVKMVQNKVKNVSVCNWSLSADHRVTDAHQASLFLNKINTVLQNPEKLG